MNTDINRRQFVSRTSNFACAAFAAQAAGALTALADGKDAETATPAPDRIARLLTRVAGLPPREICFERAWLMTRSYRQTAGQPPVLRRAKAFLAIAEGMPINIGADELLVGNIASKPRVAYFAPETWHRYEPGREQVLGGAEDMSPDLAIRFRIPEEIADFWRSEPKHETAGHFVADYAKVIGLGFAGLRQEVERCREEHRRQGTLDAARAQFFEAAAIAAGAGQRFAVRHAEHARTQAAAEPNPVRKQELEEIAQACRHVAAHPARTFREALQAFWLTHVLIHLNSSEWSISPGRFDQYMGPYYQRDIAAGRLTRQQAGELLGCLWIKFNEVRVCSADFIIYQNLMIGGTDREGRDATNDLSYLCLETTDRLKGLVQPSLSMRWHPGTPAELLSRATRLILTGCGRPALFSDRACIAALEKAGVRPEHSWDYSIAGCEELTLGGKLFGVMRGGTTSQVQCVLDALRQSPATFDDLLCEYRRALAATTRTLVEAVRQRDARNAEVSPHPFISLLFDDCLRLGRDITAGGATYNITSIAEGGTITAANALYAVKRVVYDQKRVSLEDLNKALAADFQGYAPLRAYLCDRIAKFGNDDDTIDLFAREITALNQRVLEEMQARDLRGGPIVTGSGASRGWKVGCRAGATPDGRLKGQPASMSLGPAPGTERKGPTATLNSVAKLDWREQAGGALTHLRLPYTPAPDRAMVFKINALITGFFKSQGMGLHFSVIDAEVLREAIKEPEKHLDLLVRIGGFSAPFVLLSPEMQRIILERTEQRL